jgi:tetratricopeptide (TPR) repeat protein
MKIRSPRSIGLGLLLATAACGGESDGDGAAITSEAASRASVVMALPVTSSVPSAVEHFMLGQRDLDMGRANRARGHFEAAIEADGSLASGHLRAAQIANSFASYRAHLEQAEALAGTASEAEQLLVAIERYGFDGDREGMLTAAEQLVTIAPESPRAWLILAGIQNGFNRVEDARTSMQRAIQASPEFANAHLQLANSLILRDPKDITTAEEHVRHAIELEPGEALPQDILGDVQRAAGDFEASRASYARAAELAQTDPEAASAFQQLGHVNSFLGNYDEARVNYDEAIAKAEGNARATFGQWRAFVNLHAGDAQAAIDELNALVDAIDGMNIPEPTGVKIGTLAQIASVGLHAGMIAQAENALGRRAELMRTWIEEVGTEEFRRGQEANIAFFDGLVAVENGQHDVANARAQEIMELVEPENDPRKFELAHQLLGSSSLAREDYEAALQHLEQANTNNVYNQYERALAHEALGQTAEAQALYRGIADNRFNDVNTAMLRSIALEKTM